MLSDAGTGWSNRPPRHGDVIVYSCAPGLKLVGVERASCGPDGTWSLDAPACADPALARQRKDGSEDGESAFGGAAVLGGAGVLVALLIAACALLARTRQKGRLAAKRARAAEAEADYQREVNETITSQIPVAAMEGQGVELSSFNICVGAGGAGRRVVGDDGGSLPMAREMVTGLPPRGHKSLLNQTNPMWKANDPEIGSFPEKARITGRGSMSDPFGRITKDTRMGNDACGGRPKKKPREGKAWEESMGRGAGSEQGPGVEVVGGAAQDHRIGAASSSGGPSSVVRVNRTLSGSTWRVGSDCDTSSFDESGSDGVAATALSKKDGGRLKKVYVATGATESKDNSHDARAHDAIRRDDKKRGKEKKKKKKKTKKKKKMKTRRKLATDGSSRGVLEEDSTTPDSPFKDVPGLHPGRENFAVACVGDRVEATWAEGSTWYGAVVTAVRDTGYTLRYDDGDTAEGVWHVRRPGETTPMAHSFVSAPVEMTGPRKMEKKKKKRKKIRRRVGEGPGYESTPTMSPTRRKTQCDGSGGRAMDINLEVDLVVGGSSDEGVRLPISPGRRVALAEQK
jgi:hypothetical protein